MYLLEKSSFPFGVEEEYLAFVRKTIDKERRMNEKRRIESNG
jgi:hypothetical protein